MATSEHAKYVISASSPFAVQQALESARQMIAETERRMSRGPHNIPEDPRLMTPMHQFYALFFKVEPGLASMGQIKDLKERFSMLGKAAVAATVLCVSAADPMSGKSTEMKHAGFAELGVDGAPTIYLCPSFFQTNGANQARTIVHELAHARLGAGHNGGIFLSFECGPTPVKSFKEAIDNAYVYDAFAYCVADV